jgi:hypothetical protein
MSCIQICMILPLDVDTYIFSRWRHTSLVIVRPTVCPNTSSVNRGEDRREHHLVLLVGASVIVGLSQAYVPLMYIFKSIYLK